MRTVEISEPHDVKEYFHSTHDDIIGNVKLYFLIKTVYYSEIVQYSKAL